MDERSLLPEKAASTERRKKDAVRYAAPLSMGGVGTATATLLLTTVLTGVTSGAWTLVTFLTGLCIGVLPLLLFGFIRYEYHYFVLTPLRQAADNALLVHQSLQRAEEERDEARRRLEERVPKLRQTIGVPTITKGVTRFDHSGTGFPMVGVIVAVPLEIINVGCPTSVSAWRFVITRGDGAAYYGGVITSAGLAIVNNHDGSFLVDDSLNLIRLVGTQMPTGDSRSGLLLLHFDDFYHSLQEEGGALEISFADHVGNRHAVTARITGKSFDSGSIEFRYQLL